MFWDPGPKSYVPRTLCEDKELKRYFAVPGNFALGLPTKCHPRRLHFSASIWPFTQIVSYVQIYFSPPECERLLKFYQVHLLNSSLLSSPMPLPQFSLSSAPRFLDE